MFLSQIASCRILMSNATSCEWPKCGISSAVHQGWRSQRVTHESLHATCRNWADYFAVVTVTVSSAGRKNWRQYTFGDN